jgi:hypothetical protein
MTLEQVLADTRGEAAVLRRAGHAHDAALMERVCAAVSEAAEDYLTWLSETDAKLRSGHADPWFRARRVQWQADGHARKHGRDWHYRALIIPRRANVLAAYEAGRRAGAA